MVDIVVKTQEDAMRYNDMQEDAMVVMFYHDECDYCKDFKPIFKGKFANEMKSRHPNTKVAMIDTRGDGYNHIKGFGKGLSGVPTIMYFTREQANMFEYDPPGVRTYESLMKFVDKKERVISAQHGGGGRRVKHKRTKRRKTRSKVSRKKNRRKSKTRKYKRKSHK